ncbi:MAG: LPS export ABC transporter periplasmic protein LptC [Piscirickettsiaceae bacterium]|nr:MAG: LPS export ABC transporter periplasmic protein LptC [Piscirickettsiaceae bacterium]
MKYLGKLLLAILAAGTWWLAFLQEPEPETAARNPSHKVDYYLRHFSVLSLTDTGTAKQKLRAYYLQHFADDDSTELTAPNITMFSPDKPDLHITSDTGYISADGELVLLNGAVNIHRKATKDKAAMVIDTHNLRIQLANDFAETSEYVKIVSGKSTVEGIGLKAHFREPINIKLLADVRGHHGIK